MNWPEFLIVLLTLASYLVIWFFAYDSGQRSAKGYMDAASLASTETRANGSFIVKLLDDRAHLLHAHEQTLADVRTALVEMRGELEAEKQANQRGYQKVEDALVDLFVGFERAGIVKPGARRSPSRQVGEPPANGEPATG